MRTQSVLAGTVIVTATFGLLVSACGAGNPPSRVSSSTSLATGPRSASPASVHAGSGSAVLTASSGAGTITTTGTGTVSGAPDTMTLAIDVSTTAAHASAALAQNNVVATGVHQSLERDGVAAKDIQTSGLSLQETNPPQPAGYQVDDQVSAILRNLSKAGAVIDDAVSAAGDAGRLDGVGFSMSDTSPLTAVARQQAVAAARADAEQLAAAAGEHLDGLSSLTDQTQPDYPEAFAGASSAAAGPSAVPIRPGTQQLSVSVTAVWMVGP